MGFFGVCVNVVCVCVQREYIHIYIYMYTYVFINVYAYTWRTKERERWREGDLCMPKKKYAYVCRYIEIFCVRAHWSTHMWFSAWHLAAKQDAGNEQLTSALCHTQTVQAHAGQERAFFLPWHGQLRCSGQIPVRGAQGMHTTAVDMGISTWTIYWSCHIACTGVLCSALCLLVADWFPVRVRNMDMWDQSN